jgi:aspartokinase-like uncharacterized kinase
MNSLRVVKVGGSLLDWPLLPRALSTWLDSQPPMTNVFIAGGGPLADSIRQADATFNLGDERSHVLCLEVLGVTARLLGDLLAERARLVSDLESIASAPNSSPWFILDARRFVQQRERQVSGERLPHTWDVTSDSIAVRVAIALAASELVLLKSCDSPTGQALEDLARAGIVDRFFPHAASAFSGTVRLVNLRAVSLAAAVAR